MLLNKSISIINLLVLLFIIIINLFVVCTVFVNEIPDVQAGFRKGRGTRDQIANIHWIIKKAREFQKNIYSCFID